MRLPDEVLQCVVFIGKKTADGDIHYGGTGFFVLVTAEHEGTKYYFTYLVTAKHVAQQIQGDVFYLRLNGRNTGASDVPLNWEHGKEVIWYEHPNDPVSSDIAITPIQLAGHGPYDVLAIPSEMIVTDSTRKALGIGIGDEVFAIGMFSYLQGKSRSIPIVRTGNIAMFPDDKVRVSTPSQETLEVDGFLIEARSISALSGSPVLARRTAEIHGLFKWGTNQTEPMGATAATLYLLGFICAHWEITESIQLGLIRGVNVGLAVVIPGEKILDILNGRELSEMREKDIQRAKAKKAPLYR